MDEKRQRAPRSDTKLLQACLDGNLAIIRERIAAGANVNAGRKDKRPPLETAARCGHLEVVRELIAAGADVNQIAKVNFEVFPGSALNGAIKQHHFEIAQELVRAGASVALETHPGCNAASEAAFKTIEMYWRKSSPLKWFVRAIEMVSEEKPQLRSFEDWFDFLKQAVAAGAKVNDYCLWEACKLGCTSVALYLISIGVNINVMPHEISALQKAIQGGLDEVALALIAAGADPNLTGKLSSPPIKLARAKKRHKIVRALLDAGATPLTN
ncbi:MAG: ankyrin repeat domain-containing protein [Verrucomicrobia bacterium]|nr:ankyrin repeat domain-containing protein [Verrucomicrobiota bacterium]